MSGYFNYNEKYVRGSYTALTRTMTVGQFLYYLLMYIQIKGSTATHYNPTANSANNREPQICKSETFY